MRKIFLIVLFFYACPWLMAFSPKNAAADSLPFQPGEKLTYEIKWYGIPAGEAVLTVLPQILFKGEKAHHFEMTVKTYPFLDHFYKVRDKLSSITDLFVTRSLRYEKIQREGHSKRDVIVSFDWEKGLAQFSNFNEKKPPIEVMAGSRDPFSILYAARMLDFTKTETIRIPVTDGKKCIIGKAAILGRQPLKTDSGTYDTWLLETRIEEIGGVFEKCKGASIRMWVTTDHRRLPVKLESEISIGKFTGELISAKNVDLERLADRGSEE